LIIRALYQLFDEDSVGQLDSEQCHSLLMALMIAFEALAAPSETLIVLNSRVRHHLHVQVCRKEIFFKSCLYNLSFLPPPSLHFVFD
jgi:hypothetical protein